MNLFQILGTIAVKNSEANEAIDETTDKAEKAASTLGDKFTTAGNKISGIGKKLTPLSATVAGIGTALIGLATKTASTTDNIDKMSQKLGISRTAYQEWDYILSQNGASIDSLKMGMKTLNGVIDSSAQAGSTAGTAFERLGISYDDLKGKTQEEIFEMTVTALQNCADETERTALANDLLGRSGTEMAPLLNSGAEATEALRQKAHDLGLVLNDETINAGVNMTDAMDTMKRSLSAAGSAIATAVMPYVTQFCYFIAEHMPQVQQFVQGVIDKWNNLSPAVKEIIGVIAGVVAAAGPVLMIGGKIISGIGSIINIAGTLGSAASTLGGIIAALASNPMTLIVAAIAAVVAIGVELYRNWDTVKEKCQELWGKVTEVWENVKTTVSGAVEAIGGFINNLKLAIPEVATNALETAKTLAEGARDKIIEFIGNAKTVIPEVVTDALNTAKNLAETARDNIIEFIDNAKGTIPEVVTTALDNAKNLAETTKKNIIEFLGNAKGTIPKVVTTAIDNARTFVGTARDNIIKFIGDAKGTIPKVVTTAIDNAKTVVENARDKIVEFLGNAKGTLPEVVTTALDTAKTLTEGARDKIVEFIGKAKGTLPSINLGVLETAKTTVSNAVKKIKGFFNFSWSLPKPKLPHFSVSGGEAPWGFMGQGSLPSIGISWYKKAMDNAMILKSPSIFGYSPASGNLLGGGEAGSEVVSGTDTLMRMINAAVLPQNSELAQIMYKILDAILEMDENMGEKLRGALEDMTFSIGNREFARLVKAVN